MIKNNRSGVSPVIATILMVAMTVVLAAVLYTMVSSMVTNVETTPKGAFQVIRVDDATNWTVHITTVAGDVKIKHVKYQLKSSLNGSVLEEADLSSPEDDIVRFNTDGNVYLDSYDSFFIDSTKGVVPGDVFMLLYKPTGDVIASQALP